MDGGHCHLLLVFFKWLSNSEVMLSFIWLFLFSFAPLLLIILHCLESGPGTDLCQAFLYQVTELWHSKVNATKREVSCNSTLWKPEVCPARWHLAAPGYLGCWNEQGEGADLTQPLGDFHWEGRDSQGTTRRMTDLNDRSGFWRTETALAVWSQPWADLA